MPHQCVHCKALYEDGSKEILSGCPCGGKLFFFIKKDKLKKAEEIAENLSEKEKEQIEGDVRDIMGDEIDDSDPVVLDLESVRILKPGKFELDLVSLFQKDHPLIYKLEEGKYMIDLPQTLQRLRDDKKKKK